MKRIKVIVFFLLIIVLNPIPIKSQKKNIIKSNILSLLITTPQFGYERKIANRHTLLLSAFAGKFTFLSETKVRGVNLLHRYYIFSNKSMGGFYSEVGVIYFGDYNYGLSKYENYPGMRGGFGYQLVFKDFVGDLGLSLVGLVSRREYIDINGNPIGPQTKVEPTARINASIGYQF